MSAQQMGLVIFFALLFVVVVPVITAKNGGDLFRLRKKQRGIGAALSENERARSGQLQANGSRGELLDFMAALLKAAQKSGAQLVCPGALRADGQLARFAALLVTETKVTGVYCLGYGGRVTCRTQNGTWKQLKNGEEKELPNYFAKCEEWQKLGRKALSAAGITGVPFEAVAVFTNRELELDVPANAVCFARDSFLERMQGMGAAPCGAAAKALAQRLNQITVSIPKQGPRKKGKIRCETECGKE